MGVDAGMKPDEAVELRGNCPRGVVDVLDAFSNARRMTRMELVNQILRRWAKERLHEASLVQRVTRGNPELMDSDLNTLE